MKEINLALLTKGKVTTLSGQERGRAARLLFELDSLDKGGEQIVVQVPEKIDSLTPSFLQGMFSLSIRHFGGGEKFLLHYQFDAPIEVLQQVDRAIRNTMIDRNDLFN